MEDAAKRELVVSEKYKISWNMYQGGGYYGINVRAVASGIMNCYEYYGNKFFQVPNKWGDS